jgi:alpha-galactosidase
LGATLVVMRHAIENQHYRFSLDAHNACWSLFPCTDNALSLQNVRMEIAYRCRGKRFFELNRWTTYKPSETGDQASLHGASQQTSIFIGPDRNGLQYRLDFALLDECPLFLWKLTICNEGRHPVYIDRLTLCDSNIYFSSIPKPEGHLRNDESLAFFSNGWQSWSYAGIHTPTDHFRRTRLGFLRTPCEVNAGTPQPRRSGHFASDMFGVVGDRRTRSAILAGFLSQLEHFGTLEVDIHTSHPFLRMWANGDGARLDPSSTLSTDWACLSFLNLDSADPLAHYLSAVSRQSQLLTIPQQTMQADSRPLIPTGWCSWYQFSSEDYTGALTAENIIDNLHAVAQLRSTLPLEVIQIDDGFESQIGDWFTFSSGFPEGVAPLAAEIHRSGFTPGLWLAPFIVHPKSHLYTDHPDWLLRNRFNRPANAGFLWNAFTTGLDLTHPGAMDYVREVIHTAVQDWDFPYLKLDFLYAAALPGRYHDPTKTRAKVLRAGLQAIREVAGNQTFLLGCGCPLGPAIGLVDAMRISADVARRWKPSFKGIETFFEFEPNLPSTRNSTHNSITRAPLHHRWWVNDPDCLLVRPETCLSLAEVQTLATVISLTGGSFLLSDDLPSLAPERLRLVQSLLPPIGLRPRIFDWFDSSTPRRLRLDLEDPTGSYYLLALFNWDEKPLDGYLHMEDYALDSTRAYYARDFWNGEIYYITDNSLELPSIPSHGVILLAVRPATISQPQYLGSDMHISQGHELTGWQFSPPNALLLYLSKSGQIYGSFDLFLPETPHSVLLNRQPLSFQVSSDHYYRFTVEFIDKVEIHLSW